MFVLDPKGELAAATAWYRKNVLKHRVFIVRPECLDGSNARFNPLLELRVKTEHEILDAYNLATAICDPDGSGFEGDSGVWKKRARELMAALMLHILYLPKYSEKSLRTVINFLTDPSVALRDKFEEMKSTQHDPSGVMGWLDASGRPTRTHPFVASAAQQQLDRDVGEATSVKSETETYLNIFRDNKLGANTAVSDFAMADIMNGPVPCTIYYQVNPRDSETYKPYTRLFLNMLINQNLGPMSYDANVRPIRPYRYKLGMLLDEWPMLGRLDLFVKQLAYIAGWGIKVAIVAQSSDQIEEVYGERNSVLSNIHTVVFSAMNTQRSAEMFSAYLGNRTYYYEQKSRGKGGSSKSDHAEGAPLITPAQMRRIPKDELIVLMGHEKPFPVKKIVYYEDDSGFKANVRVRSVLSDRIPAELQTGYETRVAEQRATLERCQERMRAAVTISVPAATEQSPADQLRALLLSATPASVGTGVGSPEDDDEVF
jgi:type IV secretion system protein VirD4